MTQRDHYYNKAKQEGYRSRSAYKLQQLDETAHLLDEGATVVDLGAAPGGWLQVAAERVGESGTVVGVDRQRIDPLEGIETVRGDMTDDATKDEIRERVGEADLVVSDMAPNMTGEYELDHARSVHLARQAFEVALDLLEPGGDLVAKGRLTAPVSEGEQVTVEIVDTGHEGDGIAKVEGYTLFVSGAEEGEELRVRVDDVKPNYGFAQPVE